MRSLRSLCHITLTATAIVLALLIVAGFLQNSLMSDYSAMVKESESTIFFYSTIREQATEGILSRDSDQLLAVAREMERLQTRYTSMLDNRLIPSHYKLSLLQDQNLEQIVVDLRKLAENPGDNTLTTQIIGQLRQINSHFLRFDRVVVNEMRNRVMKYQKGGLILMGFIIVLTSFSLIILHRKSVSPLVSLAVQSEQALKKGTPLSLQEKQSSRELQSLVSNFNHLLQNPVETESYAMAQDIREAEISAIINEVTNRLNGIINYSQLLADYCEAKDVGDEQKEILYKIIKHGEKSAAILQKGIHGGDV